MEYLEIMGNLFAVILGYASRVEPQPRSPPCLGVQDPSHGFSGHCFDAALGPPSLRSGSLSIL
jgi:hypothetical protein